MIKTQHCPNCEAQAAQIEHLRDNLKNALHTLEQIRDLKADTDEQAVYDCLHAKSISAMTLVVIKFNDTAIAENRGGSYAASSISGQA